MTMNRLLLIVLFTLIVNPMQSTHNPTLNEKYSRPIKLDEKTKSLLKKIGIGAALITGVTGSSIIIWKLCRSCSANQTKKYVLTASAREFLAEHEGKGKQATQLLEKYNIDQMDQYDVLRTVIDGDHRLFLSLCEKYEHKKQLRDLLSVIYEERQEVPPAPTITTEQLYNYVVKDMGSDVNFSGWNKVARWEERTK